MTSIWDMESLVNPNNRIQRNDDNLNHEIENVETRLRVVPSGIRSRSWHERDTSSEGSAKGEDRRRKEDDITFSSEAPFAEFLYRSSLWENEVKDKQRDWKECRDAEVGRANELDVSVDALGVVGEGEEALNSAGDKCN